MDKDLEKVVAAWKKGEVGTTGSAEAKGRVAFSVVSRRLRGVTGAKPRREVRAATIKSIVDALSQADLRASTGDVNRALKAFHAVQLLDVGKQPMRIVRALLPLVKRQPKDESWILRKPDEARGLVKQIEGMTVDQVVAEVDRILGRKPRSPRARPEPKPRPAMAIIEDIAKLDGEQQKRIYLALAKKFGQVAAPPRTIPIPDKQVDEKKPGLLRRLAG